MFTIQTIYIQSSLYGLVITNSAAKSEIIPAHQGIGPKKPKNTITTYKDSHKIFGKKNVLVLNRYCF